MTDNNEWQKQAACIHVEPELFFPEGGSRNARMMENRALAICDTCPVSVECLRTALQRNEEYGIWGGTTAAERTRIRRRLHL